MNSLNAFFTLSPDFRVWLPQLLVLALLTLLGNFLLMRLLDWGSRFVARSQTFWDDAIILSLRWPLQLSLWVLSLGIFARMMARVYEWDIGSRISIGQRLALILLLTFFGFRLTTNVCKALASPNHQGGSVDKTTVAAIGRLTHMTIAALGAMAVLQTLGVSVSGVLAFGGVGGLVAGLAAKDLLANFFGGMMVYLDKPFVVGEWVRSNEHEIEGTVEHIGWRVTRIRTFEQRPIYIPNSLFTTIVIENVSRMTHRRIYENFGIRYEDAAHMTAICNDVRALLQSHPKVDQKQLLLVHFNRCADSCLEFMVYALTTTTEWAAFQTLKQEILLGTLKIIAAHGAECAFPTRTLHVAALPVTASLGAGKERPG